MSGCPFAKDFIIHKGIESDTSELLEACVISDELRRWSEQYSLGKMSTHPYGRIIPGRYKDQSNFRSS